MTNHFVDYKNSDVVLMIQFEFGGVPSPGNELDPAWPRGPRHTKLIVVDPRFTRSAALADIYAPIRPGTDSAFLLGMINYALENNLYHHDWKARRCSAWRRNFTHARR
ncbi:hypothetical protein [Thermodesulfitimonas sp.]